MPSAPPREHDMDMQSHGGMQMSKTNGAHQTAPMTEQMVPNTPEGIWPDLHKHQAALELAVQNKKLDEIHLHAVAIKELTKAQVDIVHPDHRAAVQSGVDKINTTVSDLHKGADAKDQAAAEANFKRLEEALKQLEEQMKKQ